MAEKRKRTQALSKYTRTHNTLIKLLEDNAPKEVVVPQFEATKSCWDALEAAQDEYLENVEDLEDAGGLSYLDEPGERHTTALVKFSGYLKGQDESEMVKAERKAEADRLLVEERNKREAKEKKDAETLRVKEELERRFQSRKLEVDAAIESFNRMAVGLKKTLEDVSDASKYSELKKTELDFKHLKEKYLEFVGIDGTQDTRDIQEKFAVQAEKMFIDTQAWLLSQLKDVSITSGGSSGSSSSTKKEAVKLPRFQGDEKMMPFLKFPIWLSQWNTLIEEYDEKWRSGLLFEHLDEPARLKFVGYETDYPEAMVRLNKFYGDPLKVVSCVMKEVMGPRAMSEGDYKGLLSYSVILENNFNRLKSIGLEHEMSNTSAMASIMKKFPRSVAERWNDYLSERTVDSKAKPFPVFVDWMKTRKETWERMLAADSGRKDVVGGKPGGGSYFGETEKKAKTCYGCGEEGHIRFNCPEKKSKDKLSQRRKPTVKKFWCALHKGDPSRRCSSDGCQELRRLDATQRIKLLKENGDCCHCIGDHKSVDCLKKERVCGGGKEDRGCPKSHCGHELFCLQAKVFSVNTVQSTKAVDNDTSGVLLLVMQVKGQRKGTVANVFWDIGCTSNFVREGFAKMCGFKGRKEQLSVTTIGGVTTDLHVLTYTCYMRDVDGRLERFEAYGMETITGSLSKMNPSNISKLFPHLPDNLIKTLERGDKVDILIGMTHPSWHPERIEKARDGDLWIYRGRFGSCLGGCFPGIEEDTRKSDGLFHVNQVYHIQCAPQSSVSVVSHELEFCLNRINCPMPKSEVITVDMVCNENVTETIPTIGGPGQSTCIASGKPGNPSLGDLVVEVTSLNGGCESTLNVKATPWLPEKKTQLYHGKTSVLYDEDLFFKSQSLGTMVEPRCGGCKCSKCPIPGSKFSFKEQQEFDVINKNLFRVEGVNRWYTEYPWHCPRSVLPKNEKTALQNLRNLERSLSKNAELAEDFNQQIKDMVSRGAAIALSEDEVAAWTGDYYYLPMVGVKGKKKWLRVCFDASRRQGGYPSLNDCLLKGPDRFLNNLLSVIIGFRNGRVGAVADISKFHNQVHLTEREMHMQRFLWRGMDKEVHPVTYAVTVNNFGVMPANCIATCALHRSADQHADKYPVESREMKEQTYIDDQLVAAANREMVLLKTERLDEILEHAGMPNKGWVLSGVMNTEVSIGDGSAISEEKVLGLSWEPGSDMFTFHVVLKFIVGPEEVSVSSENVLLETLKLVKLTRRVLLANVAKIFDPVGFLIPIILQSKLLMRESWCGKSTGWDDVILEDLGNRWISFLSSLLNLQDVRFPRSLWPEGETDGLPSLVIFSDGSALAFGAVAYIRWKLTEGGFWSQLIMAKGKIAPKGIESIPRMELNGAVMGNRIRNFLVKETNLNFSKIHQLVDSSTVLGYLQKECGHFKPYEGIRIAEIQSSNTLKDGKLKGWGWIAGDVNPADWCTKPRSVKDLSSNFWLRGPDFLTLDEAEWPVKYTYKKENFEGELKIPKAVYVAVVDKLGSVIGRLITIGSSWKKIVRVLGRILRLGKKKGVSEHVELSAPEVKESKLRLVKFAQKEISDELEEASEKGTGRYRKLAPMLDSDGTWRVGSRLKNFVPFTLDSKLPYILPPDHRITLLIMLESHQFHHAGQDGTLSRFRATGYWSIRAGRLAKSVKNSCVPCRKIDLKKELTQPMGEVPVDVLKDPVAWGCCQMDLFGPFYCRGDVNPRTTKKTWGFVMEDVNSGAVHLDIVQDYSAEAVLLSLRRFGSLRGWPGIVQSDPGSQLVSASGKLVSWWSDFEDSLRKFAKTKNFQWKVSPPDSPWRQGKAERRIAIVKRLIRFSLGDTRVTPVELQTVFMEIGNICNERPIGLSKPHSDGIYDLITPNNLLLGRSGCILPDDAEIADNLPISARYRLVRHVTCIFWKKWSTEVSPGLVVRQKWHKKQRNLCTGDLVMICDSSPIKSKYKLGIVEIVYPSKDGFVRSVSVRYVNIQKNSSGNDVITNISVKRSVQRLVLILPVEEQLTHLEVEDHELGVIVKAGV